jgi:hypothetical protein
LGIDLPVKRPSLSPDYVTLCLAIDACKLVRFEKETDEVWMYGQGNEGVVLDSYVLTSYVECLVSFGEQGADIAVEMIVSRIRGKKMPSRCVRPDEKTIKNARWCLVDNGWKTQAVKNINSRLSPRPLLFFTLFLPFVCAHGLDALPTVTRPRSTLSFFTHSLSFWNQTRY